LLRELGDLVLDIGIGADQLRALLTPENTAALATILGILGPEAIRAAQELVGFATGALTAPSDADLDQAGEHLATAVAIVGVDGAMALLAHKATQTLGDSIPTINTRGPQRRTSRCSEYRRSHLRRSTLARL
jgi:hypothetical protein